MTRWGPQRFEPSPFREESSLSYSTLLRETLHARLDGDLRERDDHLVHGNLRPDDVSRNMRTRVIAYVRVSSEGQAEDGVSLAAQRARVEAYALAMDLELVGVEEDAGYSAKTLVGRRGLERALKALEQERADGLLVAKLDRLTRSVRDLGHLVDRYFASHWSLLSVSDSIDTRTAAGRLILNVLTSVAQWEREATAERTREALAHLKAEGVKIGGEAFGWRRSDALDEDGRRVIVFDDEEVATIVRICQLRASGASLRAIAIALNAEGRKTKRGGRWDATTVRKILGRSEPDHVRDHAKSLRCTSWSPS